MRADRGARGFCCASHSRRLGGPVVPLLRGKAEIGEQPIVDHEALSQQAMIVVAGQRREPERDGVQAGGLRREVGPRGIGAAHDQRERGRATARPPDRTA